MEFTMKIIKDKTTHLDKTIWICWYQTLQWQISKVHWIKTILNRNPLNFQDIIWILVINNLKRIKMKIHHLIQNTWKINIHKLKLLQVIWLIIICTKLIHYFLQIIHKVITRVVISNYCTTIRQTITIKTILTQKHLIKASTTISVISCSIHWLKVHHSILTLHLYLILHSLTRQITTLTIIITCKNHIFPEIFSINKNQQYPIRQIKKIQIIIILKITISLNKINSLQIIKIFINLNINSKNNKYIQIKNINKSLKIKNMETLPQKCKLQEAQVEVSAL